MSSSHSMLAIFATKRRISDQCGRQRKTIYPKQDKSTSESKRNLYDICLNLMKSSFHSIRCVRALIAFWRLLIALWWHRRQYAVIIFTCNRAFHGSISFRSIFFFFSFFWFRCDRPTTNIRDKWEDHLSKLTLFKYFRSDFVTLGATQTCTATPVQICQTNHELMNEYFRLVNLNVEYHLFGTWDQSPASLVCSLFCFDCVDCIEIDIMIHAVNTTLYLFYICIGNEAISIPKKKELYIYWKRYASTSGACMKKTKKK